MRHEHLVVTVEADLKERIDADLGAGESLEAWVADAIQQKLDQETARSNSTDSAESNSAEPDSANSDADSTDIVGLGETDANSPESATPDHSGERTEFGDERDPDDEYDEGFEYVDDCAI